MSAMMLLARGAVGIAISYVVVCGLLYVFQRSLIYHATPVVVGLGEVETLAVDGAILKLQVLKRPGDKALLYFGGNGEAVAASVTEYAQALPDRTLVFVNYRSFGGSTGSPSEAALVTDARAVFDHVAKSYRDIAVIGRSLGSGVAVQLAAARPVSHLALVTPYDSLVAVASSSFNFFPVGWMLKDRFESTRFARSVSCPVLVLMGSDDEVIPPEHARRLAGAFAAKQARTVEVAGAHHNDIQLWPRFGAVIGEFIGGRNSLNMNVSVPTGGSVCDEHFLLAQNAMR